MRGCAISIRCAAAPACPKTWRRWSTTSEADRTGVTLVNLNPSRERVVTVQGGAYGEHAIASAHTDSNS